MKILENWLKENVEMNWKLEFKRNAKVMMKNDDEKRRGKMEEKKAIFYNFERKNKLN